MHTFSLVVEKCIVSSARERSSTVNRWSNKHCITQGRDKTFTGFLRIWVHLNNVRGLQDYWDLKDKWCNVSRLFLQRSQSRIMISKAGGKKWWTWISNWGGEGGKTWHANERNGCKFYCHKSLLLTKYKITMNIIQKLMSFFTSVAYLVPLRIFIWSCKKYFSKVCFVIVDNVGPHELVLLIIPYALF